MVRLIPLALAMLTLAFHEAWATTPTSELRAFFADATLILTDPETDGKHAERLGAIRAITRQVFDIREAAKLSLGPAWRDRSEAEREEFVHLYSDFLERAFIAWIAARAQIAGGPRVTFLGESVRGGQAIVRRTVLGRNGRDLPLEYRMVERGDRWAVRDVVIDGVSLDRTIAPVHPGHPERLLFRAGAAATGQGLGAPAGGHRLRRATGAGTRDGAGGSRAFRAGRPPPACSCDKDEPRHRRHPPDGPRSGNATRRGSDRPEPVSDDGHGIPGG